MIEHLSLWGFGFICLPRCKHCGVTAETVGMPWWGGSAWEGLVGQASLLIFQLVFAVILQPWLMRLRRFLCCCKVCFCETPKPHSSDGLGKFGKRKRVMRRFVRYYTQPKEILLLGFAIRFVPLCTGKDITAPLAESITDYRGTFLQVSLNYLPTMEYLKVQFRMM